MTDRGARGVAYGVGVGPGDPALMTLAAVRLIQEHAVFALPGAAPKETAAYRIAVAAEPSLSEKTLIPLDLPMTADRGRVEAAYRAAARAIEARLDRGEDVVCLTLGDPSIYSTFIGLMRCLRADGYEVRTVPGVPSFCAAAARLNAPLAEWDEPLRILPAAHVGADGLDDGDGVVLMKPRGVMPELKRALRGRDAGMVENCGMAGERVYENVGDMPDEAAYLSIIIAPARRENRGE